MRTDLVSVIIPCFNCEDHIVKTIQSCLDQGNLLKEVIVVDDQSTDESLTIVERMAQDNGKVRVFQNQQKGPNNARNYGFEQSSGSYIQWLDADDLLIPGKFEEQVHALESTGADIAYSDFRLDQYDGDRLVGSEVKKFKPVNDYLLELIKDNWNACHSYLVRRSIAEKLHRIRGWNPGTRVGQDREYFTMAGIIGARFCYVSGVYAVYNKQLSGSISGMDFNNRLLLNQELEERFRKAIFSNERISLKRKKAFLRILNTHKVKACFYSNEVILDEPISLLDLDWGIIHWKMRMVMPFILLRKNLECLL